MPKLYLIRRNLEAFTGPLTLAELKDSYKRMQFGLQDEVAGHCGPWVTLDNMERIKKQYPEVARIVHEDMLAGWGLSSDNEGKIIQNEDTKRLKVKSNRSVGLALAFLFIAVLAFVAAVYMANAAKMSGKARDQLDSQLRPAQAKGFLDRGDHGGFDEFMASHSSEVVELVRRREQADIEWLPYLRTFAFAHDGQVLGLEPKLLRGQTAAAAPVDCSEPMWRRRWLGSYKTWNDMIVGRHLVHAHWARLIAWDPSWIKRRDNKGWNETEGYYGACLNMAVKALAEVATDPALGITPAEWDKYGLPKLQARLAWLQASLKNRTATATPVKAAAVKDSSLDLWTCYEAAHDATALEQCRISAGAMTLNPAAATGTASATQDVWQAYNNERYGWNLLRVTATTKGRPSEALLVQLTQQFETMDAEDHFTRFDYQPETRFWQSLLSKSMPVEKAVETTQSEFPDVKMSH